MDKYNNLSRNSQDYLRVSPKKSRDFNKSKAERARRLLVLRTVANLQHKHHATLARFGAPLASLSPDDRLRISNAAQMLLAGIPASVCRDHVPENYRDIWDRMYYYLTQK